ncbi:MAG TPA: aspartyl protease family protein [Dehalococcoidia bacterium]|jgi:predicted aspartyl protease
MGMFQVPVTILAADGSRTTELLAWVDTGAFLSQFPAALLTSLGYQSDTLARFKLADGETAESPIGDVRIRIGNEARTVTCVFGDEKADILLGAVAMESFRLEPDMANKTLRPVMGLMLTMLPEDDTRE